MFELVGALSESSSSGSSTSWVDGLEVQPPHRPLGAHRLDHRHLEPGERLGGRGWHEAVISGRLVHAPDARATRDVSAVLRCCGHRSDDPSPRRRNGHDDRACGPRQRMLLGLPGAAAEVARGDLDPGRLLRRPRDPERDVPVPRRPRRSGRGDLRPVGAQLPAAARVLLPDPRSDDAGPAGQRPGPQLPLGDLHHERRAARGRSGHDRGCREVGDLAGSRRHRSRAGDRLLGGRARAPGLPAEVPAGLHLPLGAPGLGPARSRPVLQSSGQPRAGQRAPAERSDSAQAPARQRQNGWPAGSRNTR